MKNFVYYVITKNGGQMDEAILDDEVNHSTADNLELYREYAREELAKNLDAELLNFSDFINYLNE